MAQLNIDYKTTDSLIARARNPRIHSETQIKQLMRSIEHFGFTNPVLIDAAGNLIAGHGHASGQHGHKSCVAGTRYPQSNCVRHTAGGHEHRQIDQVGLLRQLGRTARNLRQYLIPAVAIPPKVVPSKSQTETWAGYSTFLPANSSL